MDYERWIIFIILLMISLHTRIDIKILVFLRNIYDLDCLSDIHIYYYSIYSRTRREKKKLKIAIDRATILFFRKGRKFLCEKKFS